MLSDTATEADTGRLPDPVVAVPLIVTVPDRLVAAPKAYPDATRTSNTPVGQLPRVVRVVETQAGADVTDHEALTAEVAVMLSDTACAAGTSTPLLVRRATKLRLVGAAVNVTVVGSSVTVVLVTLPPFALATTRSRIGVVALVIVSDAVLEPLTVALSARSVQVEFTTDCH